MEYNMALAVFHNSVAVLPWHMYSYFKSCRNFVAVFKMKNNWDSSKCGADNPRQTDLTQLWGTIKPALTTCLSSQAGISSRQWLFLLQWTKDNTLCSLCLQLCCSWENQAMQVRIFGQQCWLRPNLIFFCSSQSDNSLVLWRLVLD